MTLKQILQQLQPYEINKTAPRIEYKVLINTSKKNWGNLNYTEFKDISDPGIVLNEQWTQ